MTRRLLPIALLALAASGCVVHVADDGAAAGESVAQCSIACPDEGRASVRCAPSETPSCACAPAPAAVCLAPPRGRLL